MRNDVADALDILDRLEAETGCELPELSDPTACERAQRLLDCNDPPTGSDAEFCRRLVDWR